MDVVCMCHLCCYLSRRCAGWTLPLSTLGERTFSGRRGQAPETALQASRVGNEALTWWSLRHTLRLCRIRGGEMWHGGELRPGQQGSWEGCCGQGGGGGSYYSELWLPPPPHPATHALFELARWGLSMDMYEIQLSW